MLHQSVSSNPSSPLKSHYRHHYRSLRLSLSTTGFGVRKEPHKCNSLALGVWVNVLSHSFWQKDRKSLLATRADAEQRMEKTTGPLSS